MGFDENAQHMITKELFELQVFNEKSKDSKTQFLKLSNPAR